MKTYTYVKKQFSSYLVLLGGEKQWVEGITEKHKGTFRVKPLVIC